MSQSEVASTGSPETLFHKTSALYTPGDVIAAGNYGRVVRGLGGRHGWFYREQILETVRLEEFSGLPSRLSSAFAFSDVGAAESFFPMEFPNLYSVSLANPSAARCSADMTWLDRMEACHTFEGVKDRARRYWSGDVLEPVKIETLTESSLVIVQRLTKFEDD